MQSFHITCTTCQQRLKVADAAAVGEIQICPKCGSMVLVEVPSDLQPRETVTGEPPDAPKDAEHPTSNPPVEASSETEKPIEAEASQPVGDNDGFSATHDPIVTSVSTDSPQVGGQASQPIADDGPGDSGDSVPPDEHVAAPASKREKHLDPVAAAMPETKDLSDDVAVSSSTDATKIEDASKPENGSISPSNADGEDAEAPDPEHSRDSGPIDGGAAADHQFDEPVSSDEQAVPSTLPPQTTWATESFRQWAMVGAAALAGIILAFGVIGFLASRTADRAVDEQPQIADSTPANSPANELPSRTNNEIQEAKPKTTPGNPEVKAPAKKTPESDPVTVADPPEPPTDPVPPITPDSQPKDSVTSDTHSAADSVGPKVVTSDPDENVTPAKMPLVPVEDDNVEPSRTDDAATLSETLNAFAPFIDNTPFSDRDKATEAESVNTPDLASAGPDSENESLPRPEPREIDIPARLADRLPLVDLRDIPLVDFVQLISDFSTIPISLDSDALALVRIAPTKPISVQFKDASIEEILEKTLARLRLDFIASDHQLLITRPLPEKGEMRKHTIDVSDLVGENTSDVSTLADWIVDLVEPTTWEAAGGRGKIDVAGSKLRVTQDDVPAFRTLLFCEKLRVSRGLSPTTAFAPKLITGGQRFRRADQRLAQPLTMNYVEPMRLTRILKHLRGETGITCLVDWQALMEIGWTLESDAQVSTNNEPLSTLLDRLLDPMELTWRVIDETTIEITTPQRLGDHLDVEFYDVDDLISQDLPGGQLVDAARLELGEPVFQSGGGSGLLYFDVVSNSLIAALAQPQQRMLADWLASLRE